MFPEQNTRYLFLVRHGAVDRDTYAKDEEQSLSTEAIKSAEMTASIMSEHLKEEGITHVKIWYSKYKHAREHAGVIKKVLVRCFSVDCESRPELNPSAFRIEKNENVSVLAEEVIFRFKNIEKHVALLIVGHQPQLGWLCERLHKKALPIARSEILCLRFYKRHMWDRYRSRLLWTIAPTDREAFDQLRDKIKSKMDTAKLLGTFMVFLLGIVLGTLSDNTKLTFLTGSSCPARSLWNSPSVCKGDCLNQVYMIAIMISVTSLFLAIVFYLISMFAYDRLLMPTRFWAEGSKKGKSRWLPARPPSSSLLILQVNMMRIWRLLFIPATYLVGLSLIGFALVVMRADPLEYLLCIMVLGFGIYFYYRYARPCLGSED